jgi:hypothetical protein
MTVMETLKSSQERNRVRRADPLSVARLCEPALDLSISSVQAVWLNVYVSSDFVSA